MIELPFPAKILWPNGRGHHMKRHRAFKEHKAWAHAAGLDARISAPLGERVKWAVTIHPKTAHPIDDDNARASLKAYQDGLALAMRIDDRAFDAPVLTFGEPVKGGKIVVTLI